MSGGGYEKLRRYSTHDLAEVNGWYRAHGLRDVEAHQLPVVGYIVPGVGAGFLYATDSSIGFLDGFISNPRATSAERFAALNAIGEALVRDFRGKHLLVYTANDGIARWSREHDFAARGSHQLFERS